MHTCSDLFVQVDGGLIVIYLVYESGDAQKLTTLKRHDIVSIELLVDFLD